MPRKSTGAYKRYACSQGWTGGGKWLFQEGDDMDNAERLGIALYGHDAPAQKLLGGAGAQILAE